MNYLDSRRVHSFLLFLFCGLVNEKVSVSVFFFYIYIYIRKIDKAWNRQEQTDKAWQTSQRHFFCGLVNEKGLLFFFFFLWAC